MIKRLIELLKSGRILTLREMAEELDTTEEVVKILLEELTIKGVIKPFDECGSTCKDCQLAKSCSKNSLEKKVYFLK